MASRILNKLLSELRNIKISKNLWLFTLLFFIFLGTFLVLNQINQAETVLPPSPPPVSAISMLNLIKKEIKAIEEKNEFPLQINNQDIEWEEIKGIIAFDKELAVLYSLSSDYFLHPKKDYKRNLVSRILERKLVEDLAEKYGLDFEVTEQEKEALTRQFPVPEVLQNTPSIEERSKRLRDIVLKSRLENNTEKYNFIFYPVRVYEEKQENLKDIEDAYQLAQEKAIELCNLVAQEYSFEAVSKFMSDDPDIKLLNDGSGPEVFKDAVLDKTNFSLPELLTEVENLAIGKLGEVKLFGFKQIHLNSNELKDYAYGCMQLNDIKKGIVENWQNELEIMMNEADLKNNLF
ncbi:hypothetical protein KKH63_02970 [Patescibacteria group bacterium]|nr:hypothetical protein [Patescibacteria group bacterium]